MMIITKENTPTPRRPRWPHAWTWPGGQIRRVSARDFPGTHDDPGRSRPPGSPGPHCGDSGSGKRLPFAALRYRGRVFWLRTERGVLPLAVTKGWH